MRTAASDSDSDVDDNPACRSLFPERRQDEDSNSRDLFIVGNELDDSIKAAVLMLSMSLSVLILAVAWHLVR